jgi:hypothetical protein
LHIDIGLDRILRKHCAETVSRELRFDRGLGERQWEWNNVRHDDSDSGSQIICELSGDLRSGYGRLRRREHYVHLQRTA